MGTGDSTNDIAHLLGMLDPWYERNTLSLLKLPASVVCQVHLECNLAENIADLQCCLLLSEIQTLVEMCLCKLT